MLCRAYWRLGVGTSEDSAPHHPPAAELQGLHFATWNQDDAPVEADTYGSRINLNHGPNRASGDAGGGRKRNFQPDLLPYLEAFWCHCDSI
jgi:hypothetical protein